MPSVNTKPEENALDAEQDVAKLKYLFGEIPSCKDCDSDETTDWLNCDTKDPGFYLLSDEEIIADVRRPPANESKDEVGKETLQVSKLDAFECFLNGLAWLE